MTVKVGDRKQNCWLSHAKAQSISLPNLPMQFTDNFFSGVKIEEKIRRKKIFIIYLLKH